MVKVLKSDLESVFRERFSARGSLRRGARRGTGVFSFFFFPLLARGDHFSANPMPCDVFTSRSRKDLSNILYRSLFLFMKARSSLDCSQVAIERKNTRQDIRSNERCEFYFFDVPPSRFRRCLSNLPSSQQLAPPRFDRVHLGSSSPITKRFQLASFEIERRAEPSSS